LAARRAAQPLPPPRRTLPPAVHQHIHFEVADPQVAAAAAAVIAAQQRQGTGSWPEHQEGQ
jgi:hypothetical protein